MSHSNILQKLRTILSEKVSRFQFEDTEQEDIIKHVFIGFGKSVLSYVIPAFVMSRGKISSDTFRRGLALGVFVAGVRATNHFFVNLSKDGDTDLHLLVKKFHLGIGGFISALLAVLVDGNIHLSNIFMIWCIIRAVRCVLPDVPQGNILVMCLATMRVLPTWLTAPQYLHPGYKKFLDYHGGRSKECMRTLNQFEVEKMCHATHPEFGDSFSACVRFWGSFFQSALVRSAKLYFPVHAITFLLSLKWKWNHLVENMIRSSLFLSVYCTSAWSLGCSLSRISTFKGYHAYILATLPGLSIFFERDRRRTELAAYVMTYAIESVYREALQKKYVTESPVLNAVLLSICAGTLVQNNEQQPAMLMKWLFKFIKG